MNMYVKMVIIEKKNDHGVYVQNIADNTEKQSTKRYKKLTSFAQFP